MNQLDTFRFPFLGARENGEPFEYLLLEVDQEKASIAIFKWMVSHINLILQEKVNLFIPSLLTLTYQFRNNAPGIVASIEKEEDEQAYFYKIYFNHEGSLAFFANGAKDLAQHLPAESSLTDMLIRLIKDSLILKQGILVYLKHLTPYFSRIVDYSPQDYHSLENFIFHDITHRVKANEESLKALYHSLKDVKDPENVPIILNLEYLRENIESEISLDLFLLTFANTSSRDELMELLKESAYQDKFKFKYLYMNYLISIKELEKRLYSNYNQIVLIYLKTI